MMFTKSYMNGNLLHSMLLQVFAELYGTSELLSSFDSINLMPPGTDAYGGWLPWTTRR